MSERPDIEGIGRESRRRQAECWAHFDFDECLPHGDCECGDRTALELLAYIADLERKLQTAEDALVEAREVLIYHDALVASARVYDVLKELGE